MVFLLNSDAKYGFFFVQLPIRLLFIYSFLNLDFR